MADSEWKIIARTKQDERRTLLTDSESRAREWLGLLRRRPFYKKIQVFQNGKERTDL